MLVAVTVLPISAHPPAPSQPPFSEDDNEGSQPAPAYVPGEVLVKFKPAVGPLGAQNTLAAQGLQVMGAIQSIDVLKVTVEPGQELETIARLQREPSVLYAEPNYIAFAFDTIPNDPMYGNQWGLPKINGPAAWDITTGSSDVIIAVVDTGIDLDHPDLTCSGKLMTGKNFVSPGSPPDDDHGHGTHVAGIASACTNNATGVAGVAWGARLMPVKVLNSSGSGSYDWLASGITYAADQGADVINLSLGGIGTSSALEDAVEYADDRGVVVVTAAGNCGSGCWIGGQFYNNPTFYPAAYATTMAVAATNPDDNWASFSGHRPYVDVAAPGDGIYSTYLGGSYVYQDGTSMAAPFVSGLAALVWSYDLGLPNDQVRNIIQITAVDLGAPGKDDFFGHGRINAWRALDTLVNLQTSPSEVNFLIDDDSGPFPPSASVQVTTASTDPLTWTTTISPAVTWLEVVPPSSGTISAASPDSLTLVVLDRPSTYGSFDTTAIVTGTTSSGNIVGWAATEVRITYVPNLDQIYLPIIVKNTRLD
jgi:subtilisin family serine protease